MALPLKISLAFVWISSMLLLLPVDNIVLSSKVRAQPALGTLPTACEKEQKTVHPPLGWPSVVSCAGHNTFYEIPMFFREITEDTLVYCEITSVDTSEVVLATSIRFRDLLSQGSYDLGEIQSLTTRTFRVVTKVSEINACYNQTVIVSPRILEPKTCEEAIASEGFIPSSNFKAERLQKAIIGYLTFDEENSFKYHNIPLTWGRNCTHLPSKTRVKLDKVRIRKVQFSHAGIYVASATYNSMTMFIKQVNFCVKERSIWSDNIVVECKKDVYKVKRNSSFVVGCRADLQYYKPGSLSVASGYFKKNSSEDNMVCMNFIPATDVEHVKAKPAQPGFDGSCASLLKRGNEECYLYDPVKIKQEKTYLYGNLKISIDSDEQYGNYTYRVLMPDNQPHDFNFTITEDLG